MLSYGNYRTNVQSSSALRLRTALQIEQTPGRVQTTQLGSVLRQDAAAAFACGGRTVSVQLLVTRTSSSSLCKAGVQVHGCQKRLLVLHM